MQEKNLESDLTLENNLNRSTGIIDFARYATDLLAFAKDLVWIQNKNTAKTVKWEAWDYHLDLFKTILSNDEIVILKARQLGITWDMAILSFWTAYFNENAKVLIMSQGENEAWDMISKIRFIYNHLPEELKVPIKNDTRGLLTWEGMNSEIKSLPSTEKAGRGTDATLVVRDELAYHPYGEENFNAISPAIDSGGKLIDLSTINKTDVDNHFSNRVKEARDGKSKAKLVFLGWKLRPVRKEGMTLDDWFNLNIKPKYTPIKLEQEYPETIDEALRPTTTKSYFEISKLDEMEYDIMHPIKQNVIDTHNNIIRVYKPPDRTRVYAIYTDPSAGSEDPFVTGVIDAYTGEVVCTASAKLKVDLCAGIHDYLVRQYNNAFNSYEYNSVGIAFGMCLDNLNTPNQAQRRSPNGALINEKKGQYMSGDFKKQIFGDLALAIVNRKFIIHDREFMIQSKQVLRNDDGTPETSVKLHFDWLMMMAGLWFLMRYISFSEWKISSGHYRG